MTQISDKYAQLGGARGFLGRATTAESIPPDGVGRFRHYQNGSIYWHPSTGAHSIHGSIRGRWAELGWETGPLGYPTSDEGPWRLNTRISRFQFGSIVWQAHGIASYRIYAQNMAMLPFPAEYLGTNRGQALNKLIAVLRAEQPHMVGLSELFVDGERNTVKSQLRTIYPFSLEGPDEADVESDGGLLLLSRFPILESHSTIYRDSTGADSFSNKGALHARVQVPGLPTPMDLFLTHTQNPDEGGKEKARGIVSRQFEHLRSFILACRNPAYPAALFGDINTDLNVAHLNQDLMNRLQNPIDTWAWTGDKNRFPLGLTSDRKGSFKSGSPARSLNDPARHKEGERIDGILAWNGRNTWPGYGQSEVVVHQSSNGRDISDHYGLSTFVNGYQRLSISITRAIKKITVSLHSFHCLEETDEVGSDEVYFYFRGNSQNGQSKNGKSGVRSRVDTGEVHSVRNPVTLEFTDPGQYLDIQVQGMEDDYWNDDWMGTVNVRLSREEILELVNRSTFRAMPRLTRDGGEYAVAVFIQVE
jgi:endonuclease/exonuclease/phosphatase family metal-dependent hydrolase